MPVGEKQTYRFGPFELDTQCGQLRKDSVGLKLQGQPVQILEILLERPGQLVTREELRQRLWTSDTFVDFDHSLNTAIKKLRQALGDEADTPRYIETLPRRGYRLVGEVSAEGKLPEDPKPVADAEEVLSKVATTLAEAAISATNDSRRRQKWILAGVAVMVFVVAAVVGVWLSWPLPPPRVVGSKQITNDGLYKYWPVTDGNRVYITEFLAGSNVIAQVSSAGGETAEINVPLSSPPFLSDVSSDGSELLLGTGGFYDGPWWSMPLPAGTPRPLENVIGHHAVWARDGRLFFAKYDDLYTADHDGANPRKIATAPGRPIRLALSPDGRRLRFSVLKPASNTYEIWEVRVDGSVMHPLLPGWNNPPMECCGRWTPDGKYYIFHSLRNGQATSGSCPITPLGGGSAFLHRFSSRRDHCSSGIHSPAKMEERCLWWARKRGLNWCAMMRSRGNLCRISAASQRAMRTSPGMASG
ncbi:MAG TPA: winged helix-turn-helix domain-containing protein [Candidatus Sulfotelmatobacter sp.]|nr:winged helix-turn-helix domain-containing protein [Candidatus Sulfotelmatobacter sp.]